MKIIVRKLFLFIAKIFGLYDLIEDLTNKRVYPFSFGKLLRE